MYLSKRSFSPSKGSLLSIEDGPFEPECQVPKDFKEEDGDEYIPEEYTAIQRHFLMERENLINMGAINKLRRDKSWLRLSRSAPKLSI
jgi:hypothetical protein